MSNFIAPPRNPSDESFQRRLHAYIIRQPLSLPWTANMPTPLEGWDLWERIDPNFRALAEAEIYDQYYRGLWIDAKLQWWQANDATIRNCIEAARSQPLSAQQRIMFSSALDAENKRIDSYYDRAINFVKSWWTAPKLVRDDKVKELREWDEVDKYTHDMDRSEHPEHENSRVPQ